MSGYTFERIATYASTQATNQLYRNAILVHDLIASAGVYGLDASASEHQGYWQSLTVTEPTHDYTDGISSTVETTHTMTSDEFYAALTQALSLQWITLESPPEFYQDQILPSVWVAYQWRTEYLRRTALMASLGTTTTANIAYDMWGKAYLNPFSTDVLDRIITQAASYVSRKLSKEDAGVVLDMVLTYGAAIPFVGLSGSTLNYTSTPTAAYGFTDVAGTTAAGSAA